jgi:hypothetical protein
VRFEVYPLLPMSAQQKILMWSLKSPHIHINCLSINNWLFSPSEEYERRQKAED